jgi:hypothetical protein
LEDFMPRIRCHYIECVFVDDGYCGAAAVELDPDTGCATFKPSDDTAVKEDDWEEEELDELEEEDVEDEEDDTWEEEDDVL